MISLDKEAAAWLLDNSPWDEGSLDAEMSWPKSSTEAAAAGHPPEVSGRHPEHEERAETLQQG